YGFKDGAEDIEYEWFDGSLHNVKMGVVGDNYIEPAQPTFVYIRATVGGEEGTKSMSYLKTAHKNGTVHTFDDHDHCACGWTSTESGRHIHYIDRTIDVEPSLMNMTAEQLYSFKVKLYKGHEYKIGSLSQYPAKVDVEYYDYLQGQWVTTQFNNNGYDNFNNLHATFAAPITTEYYVHVLATQTITDQKAKFNTQEHIYGDYGLDLEDRNYKGDTLTVDTYSDTFSLEAGAVKYLKWDFTYSQVQTATAWEIAGDNIGTNANSVHVEGIWFEKEENTGVYYREKLSDGGYGYHNGKPEYGTYYMRIVNGSNEEKTGIKVKARLHTSA
ncbi:MAG: hypothetical protein K6E11_03885, partial [Bacilli bacterium]|nr:hypothetical protein [Bacilli bacterium]